MSDQQPISSNDMLRFAESLMKEVVSMSAAANKKNDSDLDFIEKPKKYDDSRDPHVIKTWIYSIQDFGDLKEFTPEKLRKLGVTLLPGSAQIWYQNLRLLGSVPTDWLSLKRELIRVFKPEDTVSFARDRIRSLKQMASIIRHSR